MNAIFTGTTAECLAHLAKATKVDHFAKRKTIASFVGVGDSTVYRWFKEMMLPVGEPLLRLRFYMEFLGYDVVELQSLNPPVRDAARLFAFRISTLSEIAQLVGYSEGRGGTDTLLAVFRGTQGVSKQRLEEFTSFVELYGEQLLEKKRATQKVQLNGDVRAELDIDQASARPASMVQALRPTSQKPPNSRDALIESLAGSVKALIPLARAISSDDFTAEDRARVRELADSDGVFTLANLLYRLCGERARKMHSN
ncbi:MAG: hypothetical protein WAV21_02505 [Minisyncoccia bacterium]